MPSKLLETGKARKTSRAPLSAQRRIFLIDDHHVIREGLSRLLQEESDLTICGQAENARKAMLELSKTKPDLVLIDISLPGSDGLELIKNLKAQYPRLRMMVLSMHPEEVYAERALRSGAVGYIMKNAPVSEMLGAIRTVLRDEVHLSPRIASRLLVSLASGKQKERGSLDRLSDRELEILRLFGSGLNTGEVAKALTISSKTVESHRGNIRRKLRLRTGAELIRFAVMNQENLSRAI